MSLAVAIIGAGPSGLYCAEAIARKRPDARIDIIDRLPMPYGLVRYGVAPDHQGTKVVTRVFDRLLQKAGLRFLGGVELGRDVALAELQEDYDAVVLACGASVDRRLGIRGEDRRNVFGSAAFVGWYNGHPDFADLPVEMGGVRSVAVIGNGNVAIDVVRVLAKTPAEMAKSDLAPHAATAIAAAPIREIHLIGRRGPVEASFTNAELAELGRLERARPVVCPEDLPATLGEVDPALRKVKEANLATLRGFAQLAEDDRPVRIHFRFHAVPREITGDGLLLEGPGGLSRIGADLVVSCIGYRCGPVRDVLLDEARGIVANRDGAVAPGLYVVGWARRGPSGVIATNRGDSAELAERLLEEVATDQAKPGPAGLDRRLAARGLRPVCFADWKRIEAAEMQAATGSEAPRVKLVRRSDIERVLAGRDEVGQ
ncbi:MAG: FAD-dependent oxidoreductase [Alphaproteobacteria bacterium]|nr:FAD-dependent oxidoreductase [Alphaproteobacteria bacterium]